MIVYVQRSGGPGTPVTGVFTNQQPGLADEAIDDQHADVLAYYAVRKARPLLTLYNAVNALTGAQKIAIGNDLYDTSSAPSSTNQTTDVLTFAADPSWLTGAALVPVTTGGGLTAGVTYFYRRLTATTGSLHTTAADAVANTNKINLTAAITSVLTRFGRWSDNIGANRSGMAVIYLIVVLGLTATQIGLAKSMGAAMYAQDVPLALVNPPYDPTINIPGDEPG